MYRYKTHKIQPIFIVKLVLSTHEPKSTKATLKHRIVFISFSINTTAYNAFFNTYQIL